MDFYDILHRVFFCNKQGDITRLERWDNQDAMNVLTYYYNGNRVDKITDNGYPPYTYNSKYYRDEADADPEMGYDANGNMVYDLDRGISAVRYNRLHLPDTVQFANGSQIVHSYNALGRRLATTYYTRKVATAVPVGTTLAPSANLSDYNVLNYAYNDNMVYIDYNNRGLWELDYVHTPVGYVRYYGPEEHYPFYYIRDHLGNVREVWVHPWLNHSEYVQRTQYYPSGLPWNLCTETNLYPYRYNGKEFVEMHGLDEYDSEARWYYPAIMRTTTIDPHCEQYYDTSPYTWCGNNPVNMIDPTGRDTINVSYNAKNGKWEFTNPIIAEGNDIFQVTDISGNMQSYTFSENEYKGRVNFLNLENDGKGSYNLGIYHVSGATEEGGTGFYVTPGGEASLEVGSGARIPDGVYPLFGAVGKKWITLGIGGSVLNRAIRIHSAPSSHETTNPLVWTEGCFVLFPDYEKKRTIMVNSSSSIMSLIQFNTLLGGTTKKYEYNGRMRDGAIFSNPISYMLILKTRQNAN